MVHFFISALLRESSEKERGGVALAGSRSGRPPTAPGTPQGRDTYSSLTHTGYKASVSMSSSHQPHTTLSRCYSQDTNTPIVNSKDSTVLYI